MSIIKNTKTKSIEVKRNKDMTWLLDEKELEKILDWSPEDTIYDFSDINLERTHCSQCGKLEACECEVEYKS
jgi:hypothetical protein